MSWPTWSAAAAPIPTAMAAPVQSTIMPTAINSAPSVMPPNIQYSPEQWAQAQQQNWQQWAQWQQQYQQWHQQYGAEYQKSMSALQGMAAAPQQPPLPAMPNTGVPPPLPAEPKPPLPPEDPPANQPTSALPSYSTMPSKPANAGYSTAPPLMAGQQPQYHDQPNNQRSSWQTTQVNPNKRPYAQSGNEPEQNKRPLLDRSKQWGNQQKQWGGQPSANMSYNQPPPPQQPSKPNIEELSEAEKKFDKEFAAWEAQFNKWKDQNANHPDKTQYLEYEKKWESWRNSLLERREQMRRKRLAMSGATAGIGMNKPTGFTQMPNVQQPNMEQSRPTGYGTGPVKPPTPSPRQQAPVADFPVNPNLPSHPLPHQNNEPLSFKSSQVIEETGEDFLKPSSGGGIPGLDLVRDDDGMEPKGDVIDIDTEEKQIEEPPLPKGPDFDAISKGINSILGDQKLLSMLSMVSQNPPSAPAVNTPTNAMSNIASGHNFNAPPPSYQYNEAPPMGGFNAPPPFHHNEPLHPNATPNINDQSNHSYEERSAFGENYQQHESVHNFDDQTRSSFTMGPNDQDMGYGMNNFSRNQMNKPPSRFMGAPPSDNDRGNMRSNFGPNANRPNDPGFGGNMSDNRNKFGPGRGDTRHSNFTKNAGPFGQADNFNRNDRRGHNLNNDNFNQGNNNRRDNYQNDNFSDDKYGDNFNSGNNYNKRNNFDDRRNNFGNNNFNRSGNANDQRRHDMDFTKDEYGEGGYDDYENYNEDEDYDKYHEMFNDDNEDMGPQRPGQRFQQHQGQGGPQRQNQGQGGPTRQNQGFGGPTRQNQGQGGPPFQNQGPGGPPRQNQGLGGPSHQNQGQGMPPRQNQNQMPSRFNQFQGAPPYHDRGLGQQGQQQAPPRLMDLSIAPPPQAIPEVIPEEVIEEEVVDEDPIFEPTTVIDYDHKPLKPAEPEVVVEPVHMFDYRHKPLNRIPIPQRPKWLSETVKFIREFDPLASRGGFDRPPVERYPLNSARREDWGPDIPNRGRRFAEEFEKPSRIDRRSFAREETRFERDQIAENYSRRERRSMNREDPNQDNRNQYRVDDDAYNVRYDEDDMNGQRGNKDFEELSDEEVNFENRELQKHQLNRDDRDGSRSPILSNPPNPANVMEIAMIEDIINPPGRFHRPPRIVIILRGPPGSGKTYLAKLIKDKEVENGGSAPRILSLDDYFMVEHEKEVVEDGKRVKVKEMVYEYEAEMEESYRNSFIKSFKKTVTDGYFPFIIVDNVNDKVKYFGEMWSFAKQNGFQVYICQLDLDPALCTKRNIHNRSEAEIEECIAGWEPTPSHHPTIEASGFLQSTITDVEMEEVEPVVEETKPEETPEPSSMESTDPCVRQEPWKTTFKWKTSGNRLNQQNQGRRGFGGPTWRNRGNKRR